MRGQDTSEYHAKLDYIFLHHGTTVGIGDGGNEIGMGNLAEHIPSVEQLPNEPCVTTVSHLYHRQRLELGRVRARRGAVAADGAQPAAVAGAGRGRDPRDGGPGRRRRRGVRAGVRRWTASRCRRTAGRWRRCTGCSPSAAWGSRRRRRAPRIGPKAPISRPVLQSICRGRDSLQLEVGICSARLLQPPFWTRSCNRSVGAVAHFSYKSKKLLLNESRNSRSCRMRWASLVTPDERAANTLARADVDGLVRVHDAAFHVGNVQDAATFARGGGVRVPQLRRTPAAGGGPSELGRGYRTSRGQAPFGEIPGPG